MKALGVILARGGSKGVPKKNIKLLAEVPLLAYTILEAKRAKKLSRLILSSDDADILALGEKLGCETVKRPSELANDKAASPPCVMHALNHVKKLDGFAADMSVLLQPTTPFRTAQTIDNCIDLLESTDSDSVVSVMEAPHFVNPHWVRKVVDGHLVPYLDTKDFTRRQDLPMVYWRNGQVYATRTNALSETNDFYGKKCIPYIMNDIYQINIDAPVDFRFAEFLIENNEIDFDVNYIKERYLAETK